MKRLIPLFLCALLATGQTYVNVRYTEITTVDLTQEGTPTAVNAVGESNGTVGRIFLADQAAGPKTCSSSGCRITLPTNNVTWANAATNVRLGIQDVDLTTGLEDGTFDVQADLVPGTETISSNAILSYAMESGTKSLSAGDIVYVGYEMTARGGTDSVAGENSQITVMQNGFPYATTDTGSLTKVGDPLPILIQFDDSTYGWIEGIAPTRNNALGRSTLTVNTGTNPDEICALIQTPIDLQFHGFGMWLASVATTDTFEYVVYENPTTASPDIIWGPVTVDPDQLLTGGVIRRFSTTVTLEHDTDYCFSFRPTSANSITYEYFALGAGTGVAAGFKKAQFFKTIKQMGRIDNTGAFSETDATALPMFVLAINGLIKQPYLNNFPALLLAP